MSILIYTGTPGSGKSLHAASDLRHALLRRRPCYANFELSRFCPLLADQKDFFTYIDNHDMTADKIQRMADDFWNGGKVEFREDYITLILDECQLLFNSRLWSSKDRMSYLQFLSQSRKFGVKVILVAQSAKMIDNQFRMLIEVEHNHRRIASMGPVGAAVAAPFGGRLFMVVRYLFQTSERLGMDIFRGSRSDLAMYDSYARFSRIEG